MANQFIIKNTMADMRGLSASDITSLQGTNPIYAGVELLGYHNKGDTHTPIIYYLSSTAIVDNGGSVIEVGGIKLEHNFGKNVDIRYFGAIGNNVNDDTLSIQNASSYCGNLSNKPELIFPYGYTFISRDTIYVDLAVNINMQSPLSYKGPSDRAALVIGRVDANNYYVQLKLNVTATSNRSNWGNKDYKGIVLRNCISSDIHIVQSTFFTINMECIGIKLGFVYNEIKLGDLSNGEYALLLNSEDKGWCNENNWYGGRISVATETNPDKSRYGIVIKSNDGYQHNNNVFYKTSIELNAKSLTQPILEAVCIQIFNGRQNEWISMRDEGNSKTIRTLNNSFCNKVHTGFSEIFARYDNRVDDIGCYPSTIFETNTQVANQYRGWPLLNIYSLRSYLNQYSSTKVSAKAPLRLQNSGSSNPTTAIENLTLYDEYVEIGKGAGIGTRVDTSLRKRFNVALSYTDLAHAGRLFLVCRDFNMEIISTPCNHIKISGRYNKYASTQFGGQALAVDTGTSLDKDLGSIMQFFSVDDKVKYVDIFISYYLAPAQIKSFQIFSLDGQSSALSYKEFDLKLSETIPTQVTFNGDLVISPTSQQIGWKLSGGTWKEIGGNASLSNKGMVNQSAAVSDSVIADATDLATVIALVNDLKSTLNEKLSVDRFSGQQAL